MKIQQMAFMLVALMVFFAIVAIIYFIFAYANLRGQVEQLQVEEAQEIARQLASTPELAFTSRSCASCLDMEKAFAMKSVPAYSRNLWNIDYLEIEKIYPPTPDQECTQSNYPNCNRLILIDRNPSAGLAGTQTAYVSLVSFDASREEYRFELGRIHTIIRGDD